MAEETVRFYDAKTAQVRDLPRSELAPGCVQARVDGVEGVVWIARPENFVPGPIQQASFGPEFRKLFAYLYETLHEHYPISAEQWEEGFRRDMNPLPEMAVWKRAADVYRSFAPHGTGPKKRKDIFGLILTCMNVSRDYIPQVVRVTELSKTESDAILDRMYGAMAIDLSDIPT